MSPPNRIAWPEDDGRPLTYDSVYQEPSYDTQRAEGVYGKLSTSTDLICDETTEPNLFDDIFKDNEPAVPDEADGNYMSKLDEIFGDRNGVGEALGEKAGWGEGHYVALLAVLFALVLIATLALVAHHYYNKRRSASRDLEPTKPSTKSSSASTKSSRQIDPR